jgi:hypothetical protein
VLWQGVGAVGKKDHSTFHRFFSAAPWSLDAVSQTLLEILLRFVPDGTTVNLAVDDTLCRKRGLHIFGTCMHHDPLISCRRVRLVSWGHNWVVVGVILEFPFLRGVYWCLPFAFGLYISKTRPRSQRWHLGKRPHRTRPELAVEIFEKIAEWFPDRSFHVFGDSAYGGASVLYSLVITWFAKEGHRRSRFPKRPWYTTKSTPSFADMLTTSRRESLREHFSQDLRQNRGSRKILRLFEQTLALTG